MHALSALSIAMIGTRGVPAQYGGFETAVEEIGSRLAARGHHVTVYCRNEGQHLEEHRGMTLVNLPALRRRSLETLSHSALSVVHAVTTARPDATFVFNAANAPFLPILRAAGRPTAVHMDGIEWRRAKWSGLGSKYYRWAEVSCVRSGAELIADSRGIQDYLREAHGATSHFIPYGAPALNPPTSKLESMGLRAGEFHLVVARFERENHVLEIARGYSMSGATHPLVVVGSAPYAEAYSDAIGHAAKDDSRIRLLGGVYDQELLDQLYAHAATYIHGHSVGGTNPSLLRAMGAGTPAICYDVPFNREVADGFGGYFRDPDELAKLLGEVESGPEEWAELGREGRASVLRRYDWDQVASSYENLAAEMSVTKGSRRSRVRRGARSSA